MHKTRILRKKPLEKTFLDFKKWVKSIQTAGIMARVQYVFFSNSKIIGMKIGNNADETHHFINLTFEIS